MSFVRTLFVVGLCAAALGCGPQGATVPINTADTTPPVLTSLETLGRQGGELTVTPTSGAVSGSLSATDSLAVAARADDPEGVKEVAIWGTEQKTCTDAQGLATVTGPSLAGAPLAESADPATTGSTSVQRTVSYPVRVSDYSCPQSQTLSLELVFWATAKNYGGGQAQSDQLKLTFAGP